MLANRDDALGNEALGGPFLSGDYPGQLHVFVVLMAYMAVMLSAAYCAS